MKEEPVQEEDNYYINASLSSKNLICKYCGNTFPTLNKLFYHLRTEEWNKPIPSKLPIKVTDPVTMESPLKKMNKPRPVIRSDSPEQDYQDMAFRNWRYATLQIKLDIAAKPTPICVNSGTGISLINR